MPSKHIHLFQCFYCTILAALLMVLPHISLAQNPYASKLRATTTPSQDSTVLHYWLNAAAKNITIKIGNDTVIHTNDLTYIQSGEHSYTISNSAYNIGYDQVNWSVEVTAVNEITEPTEGDLKLSFYAPRSVDVFTDPENDNFGTILVTESNSEVMGKTNYKSSNDGAGLYAISPDISKTPSYKTEYYTYISSNSQYYTNYKQSSSTTRARTPFRVRISDDSKVFVTSQDDYEEHAAIWYVPELGEDWVTVLSIQDKPIVGFDVKGSGNNLQLLTLQGTIKGNNIDANSATILKYTLNADNTIASTETIRQESYANSSIECQAVYDTKGNIWNTNGGGSGTNYGVWCTTADNVQRQILSDINPAGGAIRFTKDGKYVMIVSKTDSKTYIIAYEIDYSKTPISLSEKHKVDIGGSSGNCTDIAFDYANNMYVVSSEGEFLKVYALPNSDNMTIVTPAPAKQAIKRTPIQATAMRCTPDTISLLPNYTEQLNVHFTPQYANQYSLSYSSSDTHVATVSEEGLITAKQYGRTEITVSDAQTGLTSTAVVYVAPYADVIVEKMWDYTDVEHDLNLQDHLNGEYQKNGDQGGDYLKNPELTPTVMQAAGWNDTIFAKSVRDKNLYIYYKQGDEIKKELWRENVGIGSGFCIDDAGNMVVSDYTYTDKPSKFIIYKGHQPTSESYSYSFDMSSYYDQQICYYITATGDLYGEEGGYIYFCLYENHDDKLTLVHRIKFQNGIKTEDRRYIQYIDTDEYTKLRTGNSNIKLNSVAGMVYKGTSLGTGDMEGLVAHKRTVGYMYRDSNDTEKKMSVVELPQLDDATFGAAIFKFENGNGKNEAAEAWAYPYSLNLRMSDPDQDPKAKELFDDEGDGSYTARYFSRFNLYNYTTKTLNDSVRGNHLWLGTKADQYKRMKYGQGAETQNLTNYQIDKYSYYMYQFCSGIGMGLWKVSVAPFYDLSLSSDGQIYHVYKKVPYQTMYQLKEPEQCEEAHSTFVGWTATSPTDFGWGSTKPEIVASATQQYTTTHNNITLYCVWEYEEDGTTYYSTHRRCGSPIDIIGWNTGAVDLNLNDMHNIAGERLGNIKVVSNNLAAQNLTLDSKQTAYATTPTLVENNHLMLSVSDDKGIFSQFTYIIPRIINVNTTLTDDIPTNTSVVVRDNATLTIGGNIAVNNLTIYPNTALVVSQGATLTVGGKLIVRSTTSATGEVFNEGTINIGEKKFVHTKIMTDKLVYYLVGLPFDCTLSDITLTTERNMTLNKHYRLNYYDGASRAIHGVPENGNNWKAISGSNIAQLVGYEMCSSTASYREYMFPMTYQKREGSAQSVPVTEHTSAAANHEGWNLCVSPFTYHFDGEVSYDGSYGQYTQGKTQYLTFTRDDGSYFQTIAELSSVPPFTPFFVQVKNSGNLVFSGNNVPRYLRSRTSQNNETDSWLILSIDNETYGDDMTAIRISNRYTSEYETEADLEKMMSNTTDRPQIYLVETDGKRAFDAINWTVAEQPIAVGVTISQQGTYSISSIDKLDRNQITYAMLYDKQTGMETDMLQHSYTFQASAGTDEDRFLLYLTPRTNSETPTMLNELGISGICYSTDIMVHDASGRMIYTGKADYIMSLPNGVYVISYETANDVTSKKVVICR